MLRSLLQLCRSISVFITYPGRNLRENPFKGTLLKEPHSGIPYADLMGTSAGALIGALIVA